MTVLPWTRRQFARRLVGVPLAAGLARAEPLPLARGVFPTGELQARIRLTAERLAQAPPSFEDLEVSGLYLGALAVLPPAGADVAALVRGLLARQQEDGRFGVPDLRLDSSGDAAARVSLLRSSGRVLVGLLERWETSGDPAVLAASQRLGRFLTTAREVSSSPAAIEALRAQDGAACLTELAEGFVMLGEATEERRFFEAARALRPLLRPPHGPTAAGHLASLRSFVRLARITDDRALLRDVAARFRDLATSHGLSPAGGLRPPSDLPDDDPAGAAEFLRLALALWTATGDAAILEQAERCLVNRFRFAQAGTGDFEARRIEGLGFAAPARTTGPVSSASIRSYRAFRDVLDGLVRTEGDTTWVDLFDDVEVTLPGLAFSLRSFNENPGERLLSLEVLDAKADWQGLALRRPSWASRVEVRFDGSRLSPAPGPYVRIVRRWRAGERLEMNLRMDPRLETRDGRSHARADLREPAEALLFVGPRLMAAHEGADAAFLAEAASSSPTLFLPAVLPPGEAPASPFAPSGEDVRLECRQGRGGLATSTLTLRPLAAATFLPPGRAAVWLHYQEAD